MDYIYGELDVKNINYTGKNTSTANTTVDNIKRTIEVDVTDIPERYIDQINLIGNKVTTAESSINTLNDSVASLENSVSTLEANKANKDILNQIQITYNQTYDLTTIRFPEHTVPLSFAFNDGITLFFDLANLVDSSRNIRYAIADLYNEDGRVLLDLRRDLTSKTINQLTYISQCGEVMIMDDTYQIFHPQTGTKLYRHRCRLVNTSTGTTEDFIIVSTSSIKIDGLANLNEVMTNSVNCYLDGQYAKPVVCYVQQMGSSIETSYEIHYFKFNSNGSYSTVNNISGATSNITVTDRVTEL